MFIPQYLEFETVPTFEQKAKHLLGNGWHCQLHDRLTDLNDIHIHGIERFPQPGVTDGLFNGVIMNCIYLCWQPAYSLSKEGTKRVRLDKIY